MTRMTEATCCKLLMIVLAVGTGAAGWACASGGQAAASRMKPPGQATLHPGQPRKDGQVSLLARGFLPSSAKVHTGFAYYGYLIFTDSSPASAFARRAASQCYLDMLTKAKAVGDRAGVGRENMAVLYLPLSDGATPESLIRERDPQTLIAAYDYVRARAVAAQLKRAGKPIPGVAIIGSTRPLVPGESPRAIDILDLTDPGTVVERMDRFRSSLDARAQQVKEDGQPVVLKRLREYFAWAQTTDREGPTQLTF